MRWKLPKKTNAKSMEVAELVEEKMASLKQYSVKRGKRKRKDSYQRKEVDPDGADKNPDKICGEEPDNIAKTKK